MMEKQKVILLAEDDDNIRSYIIRTLAPLGYEILAGRDGRETLDIYFTRGGFVDLLLTDVEMPRMDGYELLRRVNRLNPAVPLLVMSGLQPKLVAQKFFEFVPDGFISKPFTGVQLVNRVIKLLSRQNDFAGVPTAANLQAHPTDDAALDLCESRGPQSKIRST